MTTAFGELRSVSGYWLGPPVWFGLHILTGWGFLACRSRRSPPTDVAWIMAVKPWWRPADGGKAGGRGLRDGILCGRHDRLVDHPLLES